MSREDLNFCWKCRMFFPSSLQAFQHPCPGRARENAEVVEEEKRDGTKGAGEGPQKEGKMRTVILLAMILTGCAVEEPQRQPAEEMTIITSETRAYCIVMGSQVLDCSFPTIGDCQAYAEQSTDLTCEVQ